MNNVERKVRKNIRINKLIKPGDNILAIGEMSYELLNKIVKDPKIKIINRQKIRRNTIKKYKINKIIKDGCLEDSLNSKLRFFFENKHENLKYTNIFDVCLEKELKSRKFKRKEDDIDKFINKLEEKHQGTKHSFAKVKW